MLGRMALLGALTLGAGFAAQAQAPVFDGRWQQVETNAGACPACRIEITDGKGGFEVAASNGWMAKVRPVRPQEATGHGVWSPANRGWVSGRPFDVTFRLIDQRLSMTMKVALADGSRRTINAVFERVWLGV